MAALDPAIVADALLSSCLEELDAPKPGNVHKFRSGHAMDWRDFEVSARVIAPVLTDLAIPIGVRIYRAVEATLAETKCNTNLGIVLLAAPLAEAALLPAKGSLRIRVNRVLSSLTMEDSQAVFDAIALASPGGLGQRTDHDVRRPATITLIQAMQIAAPDDYVARQYATGFDDILGFGLRRVRYANRRWPQCPWAQALWTYLGFLARKPDSHVRRKYGQAGVSTAMALGKKLERAMRGADQPAYLLPDLLAADDFLKSRNINPGTSADMTVGSLLGARLTDIMRARKTKLVKTPRF